MDIRETLNKHPFAVGGGVAGVVVLVLVIAFLMLSDGSGEVAAQTPATGREFFTIDDGDTWFPDDATKVPPFQHEGKTAYRVKVWKCGEDGKPFVSHLERYPQDERPKIVEQMEKLQDKKAAAGTQYIMFNNVMEVKKPGEKNWVKLDARTAEQYAQIVTPVCPDGPSEDVRPVLPD